MSDERAINVRDTAREKRKKKKEISSVAQYRPPALAQKSLMIATAAAVINVILVKGSPVSLERFKGDCPHVPQVFRELGKNI